MLKISVVGCTGKLGTAIIITKVVKCRRFYLPKFLSAALSSIAVALATAQSSALQIEIYSA